MRNRLVLLLMLPLMLIFVSAGATSNALGFSAKAQSSMIALTYRYTQFQRPVEQQTPGGATQPDKSLWVVNPTKCAWDADDRIDQMASGVLQPSERFEHSECVMADWTSHLYGFKVYGERNAQFRAGMRLVSDDYALDLPLAPPVRTGQQEYTWACIQGPDYDYDSPKLLPVPDSNGGVAIRYQVVSWIENIGDKRIRDARLSMTVRVPFSVYVDDWCPSGYPVGWLAGQYDPRIGWSN